MYRSNPLWSDVIPIEQNDGPEPVVPINYTPQFKDVMDYFRAILQSGEISQRVFDLTSDVIELNSANYTAWNYRRLCLFSLGLSVIDELKWVQGQAVTSPKNYQLWHHRRVLSDKLNDKEIGKVELEQTALILAPDAKNYHAWSYRQWLLQRFDIYDKELDYIDTLLQADVRNNSAWNQRYFVMKNTGGLTNISVLETELKYTFEQIDRVPNNESAWNYLYGLLPLPSFNPDSNNNNNNNNNNTDNNNNSLFNQLKLFTQKIIKRAPKCRHASSLLVDIYERNHEYDDAIAVCIQLAEHIDCIRMKYWLYRKNEIETIKSNK